jgi:hypothetical protein
VPGRPSGQAAHRGTVNTYENPSENGVDSCTAVTLPLLPHRCVRTAPPGALCWAVSLGVDSCGHWRPRHPTVPGRPRAGVTLPLALTHCRTSSVATSPPRTSHFTLRTKFKQQVHASQPHSFTASQLCNSANSATLQPCNPATLQPCNPATLQPCNLATLHIAPLRSFVFRSGTRAAAYRWSGGGSVSEQI